MDNSNNTSAFSIASLVLGILAIILFCVYYISLLCAILAIIFGAIGKSKGGRGMAVAGLVLGIISVALDVLVIVGVISVFTTIT